MRPSNPGVEETCDSKGNVPMGDKIWGTLSILAGAFGLFRSYQLFHLVTKGWTPWLLILAGLVLIVMGTSRLMRKPADPEEELLK